MYAPETLSGAASYVSREYGYTGYRIEPIQSTPRGDGVFVVRHSDGSQFDVIADRWGNAATVTDGLNSEQVQEFFANANAV